MAEITAKLVKELREKSGAGVMDAKKALVEVEGDIEKAIELLREKGMAKAAKKADRVAAEGLTGVYVNGNVAAVVEVNAETDFVAKLLKLHMYLQQLQSVKKSHSVVLLCLKKQMHNTLVLTNTTVDVLVLSLLSKVETKPLLNKFQCTSLQ